MNKLRARADVLREITPKALQCGIGACPAVFLGGDGRVVIVGRKVDIRSVPELRGRIGTNEIAIEIDSKYLANLPE